MRRCAALVLLGASVAAGPAEAAPVLLGPARVQDGPQAAAFAGTHQVGAAFTFARFGAELAYLQWDRRLELRAGWRADLLAAGPVFLSWRAAGALVAGVAPLDLGARLSTGLSAGLGGDPFEAYAGVEAALELRLRLALAVPLRAIAGVRVRAGLFELGAQARLTAVPGVAWVSRVEGLVVLSRLL